MALRAWHRGVHVGCAAGGQDLAADGSPVDVYFAAVLFAMTTMSTTGCESPRCLRRPSPAQAAPPTPQPEWVPPFDENCARIRLWAASKVAWRQSSTDCVECVPECRWRHPRCHHSGAGGGAVHHAYWRAVLWLRHLLLGAAPGSVTSLPLPSFAARRLLPAPNSQSPACYLPKP